MFHPAGIAQGELQRLDALALGLELFVVFLAKRREADGVVSAGGSARLALVGSQLLCPPAILSIYLDEYGGDELAVVASELPPRGSAAGECGVDASHGSYED